jgi:hypothetical protein
MTEENEQISAEPYKGKKLSLENENLVVEFGKHSKKLEEILTEDFCDVLRRNYSLRENLEKYAGQYYKGLLARGFFTPEEYEIVNTVHYLYKKQNLTAEEKKKEKNTMKKETH